MEGINSMSEIWQRQDYFCMSAVKNSISDYKMHNDSGSSEIWHLQPINNAFLQAILHLVGHMKELLRILFVLYFACSHAPEGADQVEAAYECYKFAIEHEQELNETSRGQEIVSKIKRKYPIFKVQHLLHLNGLSDESLLRLVESPIELISALYHNDCILLTEGKIEINRVSIANQHEILTHTNWKTDLRVDGCGDC